MKNKVERQKKKRKKKQLKAQVNRLFKSKIMAEIDEEYEKIQKESEALLGPIVVETIKKDK